MFTVFDIFVCSCFDASNVHVCCNRPVSCHIPTV